MYFWTLNRGHRGQDRSRHRPGQGDMNKNTAIYIIMCAAASLLLGACASMGTPEGGPRDETPPRMVRATPAPGATDVDARHIAIDFDEYITLQDAFTNVVVSPTSEATPRVSAAGRRVNVQFTDSLLPNTTYTIDFADAIRDNNEGNALEGFTYTFSTGPTLDSLRISGMVLDSRTLEPQQGVLVGVHTSDADTAFSRVRLERVARTDDRGRFTLRGLAPGRYRLFSLQDLNGDMRWDNPEERIAFLDEWIVPTAQPAVVSDTIYNALTLAVDSVVERATTRFLPNDILLSSFSLGYRPQYLRKSMRPDSTRVELVWNAPQDSLPDIRLLSASERKLSDWSIPEVRLGNDSVALWVRDPQLLRSDTIRLQVRYMSNVKRGEFKLTTDTLTLVYKRPKVKPTSKGAKPQVSLAEIKGSEATHEYPQPYTVTFGAPLDTIYADRVRLLQKVDTTYVTLPARPGPLLVRADTLNPRQYRLDGPWEYGAEYRLQFDTLAVRDIYGHYNKPVNLDFKVRAADEYGTLGFTLSGLGGSPAFVELLNSSDVVQRTEPVVDGAVSFTYLLPGTYYARVVFDANGNGLYDTGDYDTRLQPEAVAYYPRKITLRKNWDQNLTWDASATPVDLQKPETVKKNRPKARKGSKQKTDQADEEDDDYFDPTANPFDPNQRRNRNRTPGSY